jgi:glutamate:Na+ symporter, ESS family
MTAVFVLVFLSLLLIAGKLLRLAIPPLRKYFVPSSILGGLIGLLLGAEIWAIFTGRPWIGGETGAAVYDVFRQLPGFLINVVFAALFLGKAIPPLREVWRKAGPQVAFGQTLAWGQYVVGIGVTMLVLVPLYDVPPMFGALLEIGFEGGHGTAAGLGAVFESVGWAEGQDLALGVATVGVVMGVVLGMILVNWAVRRGHTVLVKAEGIVQEEREALAQTEEHRRDAVTREQFLRPFQIESIEPLALHVAYIGAAIGAGYLVLQALIGLEAATLTRWGAVPIVKHIPLFPLAMIGGILVQLLHDRFLPGLRLERKMFAQLLGVALDFLIVSAMAALSLRALAANWQPLVILMVVGIVWIVGVLLVLGPRIMPDFWFERGIGDFGQSLGMTATGLLLMRIVDPEYRSPAYEAFGYKQLLFEPFVGGGLVTAVSVPLIFNPAVGPWTFFWICTAVMVFWIAFGLIFFHPKRFAARRKAAAGAAGPGSTA